MKGLTIHTIKAGALILSLLLLQSCEKFLNPEPEINMIEQNMYDDWYEYRAAALGLYGIQYDMVEQLIILGELRGDLLTITENADADLVEIYNFNISKDNQYASTRNFFKLISSCNSMIRQLHEDHPEVKDLGSAVTNYDRLYGEVLCMRAWAYFNAVRIYGRVPFIEESLTSTEEIDAFLNSSGTYIDSIDILYGKDGYDNDTIYNNPIELEKRFFDEHLVIDYFTNELENSVKAVGVNHYMENNDNTWEITIWNTFAMHALLGSMYLTDGDLFQAARHFEAIIDSPNNKNRYQLEVLPILWRNIHGDLSTQKYVGNTWRNFFGTIDNREHIFTFWYKKQFQQQNHLQLLFDPRPPHQYMLKPTPASIMFWEGSWDNTVYTTYPGTTKKRTLYDKGMPGDFYRGYGVSYAYTINGVPYPDETIKTMLLSRSEGDYRTVNVIMENVDTVVWKYSWNKDVYDQDAYFPLYRAAGIHLWLAEVETYRAVETSGGVSPQLNVALSLVNDGSYYNTSGMRTQLGVRGRVGLADNHKFGSTQPLFVKDVIEVLNTNYIHNPYTNEITGYVELEGNFAGKQMYLEEQIMDEKARELAYEGERFYDLMRVAKRRNDPSYLAEKVSQKYPPGKREEIYAKLLDEQSWYIPVFDE